MPALTEFISAGFIITRPVARPPYVSADLLPDPILSASGCIANFIPDVWCIEWTQDTPESRIENANAFGLDISGLAEVTAWVTPKFGHAVAWPNVLMDIQVARQLVDAFLSTLPDVKVLELALHRSQTDEFCQAAEPPRPQQPGCAPMGRQGVHEAVLKAEPPTDGGHILGFEPLVFDYCLSCSWLCNHLDTAVAEHLNIRPNQRGFIETFDNACRCVNYIAGGDVAAEPGLWLPWLIIDHSEKVR
jgi:hypothetical protein